MSDVTIRFDRSKTHSVCAGDRTPEDPHYLVAFWQGQKIKLPGRDGKLVEKMVVLPFDVNGDLVPDDGKTEPWKGLDSEQKPVLYRPLWNSDMRELLRLRKERAVELAASAAAEAKPELVDEDEEGVANEINFPGWLRGEVEYSWPLLQKAARKRFGRVFSGKQQMVEDLVLDEKLCQPDEVCKALKSYLPKAEAA